MAVGPGCFKRRFPHTWQAATLTVLPVGANADSDVRPGGASGFGKRFGGRRYTLLRGLWIVFEDAPVAAPIRALAALAAGAATGPLLVLASERFIATALEVAAGGVPFAAVAAPVLLLLALFAVQILETVVRGLADARIEMGLRRGFRTDLTEKRARLEYRYLEHPETADLLRRVASGPQQESQPTPEQGPVKQAFDDYVGLLSVAVRVVGIAVVLARLGWWIVPAVLLVTVPFGLLGIRSGQRVYELERRVSRRRRRARYLAEEVLQGRDAAAARAVRLLQLREDALAQRVRIGRETGDAVERAHLGTVQERGRGGDRRHHHRHP